MFEQIKQSCSYPMDWKRAVVIPVHKKKSRTDVLNYRPVSLLSVPSKILERCIFVELFRHVAPALHASQFGFRPRRSCITQLLLFLDEVYRGRYFKCTG